MNTKTLDAVYEDGVFRPTAPGKFDLTEGQKVRLVIEPIEQVDDLLELAADVFADLSDQEIAEIEQIVRRTRLVDGPTAAGALRWQNVAHQWPIGHA